MVQSSGYGLRYDGLKALDFSNSSAGKLLAYQQGILDTNDWTHHLSTGKKNVTPWVQMVTSKPSDVGT